MVTPPPPPPLIRGRGKIIPLRGGMRIKKKWCKKCKNETNMYHRGRRKERMREKKFRVLSAKEQRRIGQEWLRKNTTYYAYGIGTPVTEVDWWQGRDGIALDQYGNPDFEKEEEIVRYLMRRTFG